MRRIDYDRIPVTKYWRGAAVELRLSDFRKLLAVARAADRYADDASNKTAKALLLAVDALNRVTKREEP